MDNLLQLLTLILLVAAITLLVVLLIRQNRAEKIFSAKVLKGDDR